MLNWLFGKSLESYIGQTKKVRVAGVRFEIKKLNALNYVDGTNSIRQTFDTYKASKEQMGAMLSDKKVIDHLKAVICGCTVHPRIVHARNLLSVETSSAALTTTSFWHVQSMSFSISNNLNADTSSRRIGSDTLQVLPAGLAQFELKATIRFDTTTAYDAMMNGTRFFADFFY